MTGSYERKEFKGAAKPATLVSAINDTDLSFEISTYVGWPDGSTGPFVVCIDRDTSLEEKILCTSRTNGQVFVDTRGYDDTSAVAHGTSVGGVEHVIDASTLDQANRYVNLQSAKGDLVAHNGTNATNVSVGTNDYVLTADSTATTGVAWSQIALAALKTEILEQLIPAGTLAATVSSTADAGWYMMGTTITNAQTLTPALWAVAPTGWRSGSNLVLPSMADKYLSGKGTSETLGASGGSNTKTLAAANLPKHTHIISHSHGHDIEANQNQHRHTVDPESTTVSISDPGHAHNIPLLNDGTFGGYAGEGHGGVTITGPNTYSATTGITASVDIAQFNSGYSDPAIEISGGVDDHTGNSGDGGTALTATALNVESAHIIVNFQIKGH